MIVVKDLKVGNRLAAENLLFDAGEVSFLLGENGAGKSTLLNAIAGINTPTSANILINDEPIQTLSMPLFSTIRAWLGQHSDLHFPLSAYELLHFYGAMDSETNAASQSLPDWLTCLSLESLLPRAVSTLSGGEYQRLQLARVLLQVSPAIAAGQAIILLDEPLSALDLKFQLVVVSLLRKLADKGNCIVLSSHHFHYAKSYADKVVMLKAGNVLTHGPCEHIMTSQALIDCYGIDPSSIDIGLPGVM